MKSIRFKILAMLGIIALGSVLSAGLSLYALSRSQDLNARSDVQGEITLLTERINTNVFAVVMDSRGIYMSKTAKEAEPFAKTKEARFPRDRQEEDLHLRHQAREHAEAEIEQQAEDDERSRDLHGEREAARHRLDCKPEHVADIRGALPLGLGLLAILFLPESPRWLATRGEHAAVEKATLTLGLADEWQEMPRPRARTGTWRGTPSSDHKARSPS